MEKTNLKYTRIQRLNNECSHEEYYSQFINDRFCSHVVARIGLTRLMNSEKESFNDIPLEVWDSISAPLGTGEKMKELGDYLTKSGQVCIAKLAARKYLNTINQ